MRWAISALALWIFVLPAPAQDSAQPASPAAVEPASTCTVEGSVAKATTGEPLRKISVSLSDGKGEELNVVTDRNGKFTFKDVPAGRYHLMAGGNGYPYQQYGQRRWGASGRILALAPGSHEKDLVFRLQPGGVITGTVYDEDGDPVVDAHVHVLRFASSMRQPPSFGAGARTDDLGDYRVYGLPPGKYYLVVTYRDRIPGKEDDVYLPTFYPGTADLGQATALTIRPGDEIDSTNISLTRTRGVRLRGRVVSETPLKVLPNVYVQLVPRDARLPVYAFGGYGAGTRDDKGEFEIRGVPPGAYLLVGSWSDANRSYFGRVPVDVGGADIDGITLALSPGYDLRGRIRTDPPARLDYPSLAMWLEPVDNFSGAAAEIKPDGSFIVRNVSDGSYRIHMVGFPEEFYLKSFRFGGLDALAGDLNINHGQSTERFEVVLSQDGGRIEGTVLNDMKPAAGATVVLVPNPPNRDRDDLYHVKTTDELGRFLLVGLAPGDYKLFAWEQVESEAWKDPDFLESYESRGTSVHVEEKKSQYVQLPLIPADEGTP